MGFFHWLTHFPFFMKQLLTLLSLSLAISGAQAASIRATGAPGSGKPTTAKAARQARRTASEGEAEVYKGSVSRYTRFIEDAPNSQHDPEPAQDHSVNCEHKVASLPAATVAGKQPAAQQ